MARFIPTVEKAAPLPIRSGGNVSATSDWADGIWKTRTIPALTVMAKICHTSKRPVVIKMIINKPREAMVNSTAASTR